MSDKARAYSDSAGTLIIKGSSMAEIQAFMQEACGLAEELRKAILAKDRAECLVLELRAEIDRLRTP